MIAHGRDASSCEYSVSNTVSDDDEVPAHSFPTTEQKCLYGRLCSALMDTRDWLIGAWTGPTRDRKCSQLTAIGIDIAPTRTDATSTLDITGLYGIEHSCEDKL